MKSTTKITAFLSLTLALIPAFCGMPTFCGMPAAFCASGSVNAVSAGSPVEAFSVSAQSAILLEADSGSVIWEKNADQRLPMASTTKIMTAVAALENASPDLVVTVDEKACGVEGSSIYLEPGERLTLEDLLYAMMLESANDAAAAIACAVSGGIGEFAALMNETAEKIGLADTHFTNPHGLDDEDHYTTAADLAKLTAYAMRNPSFRAIVSTYKRTISSSPCVDERADERADAQADTQTDIQVEERSAGNLRTLLNHNKLLKRSDDVIGVKTGFTRRSGRCLVTAAERDGVSVIAVTLNAPDDWNDHLALHELGFSRYTRYELALPGQFSGRFPCASAPDGRILAANEEELSLCLPAGLTITHRIECGHLLFAPVEKGAELGCVVFLADGNEIGRLPLIAQESVPMPEDSRSPLGKILDKLR